MESLIVPFLKALILIPMTLLPILLCIGIQIMWNGWAEVNGGTP